MAVSRAHAADAPELDEQQSNRDRLTVLVVDDEPMTGEIVRRVLARHQVEILLASNGHEATLLLDEHKIDVIVSDIQMPVMGGIELLRHVRARDRELPVILVTGDPAIGSAIEAVSLGALRYLPKPVDHRELETVVLEAARLRQLASLERAARDSTHPISVKDPVLGQRFDDALEALWIAYQPIVSWSGKRVVAYEALCRSDHPELGNPAALFGAAEELRRTPELGRAIRRRAAEAAPSLPGDVLLFVNVLPRDLVDDELFDPASPLSAVAPRIVLEITERSTLEEIRGLEERLARLRKLGYRLAVDDLGAGYSSLSSFAKLEPDIVKLDMSLIRDCDSEPIKRRLITGMAAVCRDMGAIVIAEGIETAAERDAVAGCGCDWMQGYVFARPERAISVPDIAR